MNRLVRHRRYWNALAQATPDQRKRLVKYATPDQIDAAGEMAYNVLEGNVPLSKDTCQHLKKYKTQLRGMGNPRRRLGARKRWFQQGGGNAVQALVKGVVRGLKEGAKKGLEGKKEQLISGLKNTAEKKFKSGIDSVFSNVPKSNEDDDDAVEVTTTTTTQPSSRASKIERLQREIEQMELALKQ